MDFCSSVRAEGRREPTFARVISKIVFLETQKFNHQLLFKEIYAVGG